MRIFSILVLLLLAVCPPAAFAEDAAAPSVQAQDDASYAKRLELARKMHEINPARDQINAAIDQAAESQPEQEREAFKTAMRSVLNFQAIEKISIDAMAEVYTERELQAMVNYYSLPEAKSAGEKQMKYSEKVYPEIIRMLDQAMMRVRTGGTSVAPSAADEPEPPPSASP